MNKRLISLCAVALAAATASSATAADLTRKYAAEDSSYGSSWEGGYVSVVLGPSAAGNSVERGGGLKNLNSNAGSLSAGLLAGYNVAAYNSGYGGQWLFGFEADSIGGSFKKTKHDGSLGPVTLDANWFGSLRMRAGYAWQRLYVYGTGGLAFSDIDVKTAAEDGGSVLRAGLAIGAGAEYRLDERWSARLDVLAYGFGEDNVAFANGDHDVGLAYSTARLGVSYKY